MPAGHDMMLAAPGTVADLLAAIAAGTSTASGASDPSGEGPG